MQENTTARFCPLPGATTLTENSAVTCALRPPAGALEGKLSGGYFGTIKAQAAQKRALSYRGPGFCRDGLEGTERGEGRAEATVTLLPPSPAPGRLSPAPGSLPGPRPVGASARALTPSPERRPRRSHPRPGAGDAAGRRTEPAPVALPRTPPR